MGVEFLQEGLWVGGDTQMQPPPLIFWALGFHFLFVPPFQMCRDGRQGRGEHL